MNDKTVVVSENISGGEPAIVCTAIDNDWGDERPNMLMHPPCDCPRCAPEEPDDPDDRSWLQVFGRAQRMRVEAVDLGETGRSRLG